MTPTDLERLFQYGESTWLDWKKEYPGGLLGGRKDSRWSSGRAELIKDLAAIANGDDGRAQGYLVYGVKDLGASRKLFGVPSFFDDADLQTWVKAYLGPAPTFVAWPLVVTGGEKVLVLEVRRVPGYPHVVTQDLGEVIYKGQVWWRSGSKNEIALHNQLRDMFRGMEPTKIAGTTGSIIDELKSHYEPLGYDLVLPPLADKDESLAKGLEIAYRPGTRSEVWAGFCQGRYEHLAMLRRKV